MSELPSPPQRPPLDGPSPRQPGSWISLFLAAIFFMMCAMALTLLTLGYGGIILAVVAALFGIILFHYLVWGWWLSALIEREDSDHEQGK